MKNDKLIVALDFPSALQGLALAKKLGDTVSFYKIGLDIGSTVEAAVKQLSKFDLDFLTVHGDPHVVKAAVNGASGSGLKILAVTILTSLDRKDLDDCCLKSGSIEDIVQERAANAFEAGADGVIASAQEITAIRCLPQAKNRLIVTPGIRLKIYR